LFLDDILSLLLCCYDLFHVTFESSVDFLVVISDLIQAFSHPFRIVDVCGCLTDLHQFHFLYDCTGDFLGAELLEPLLLFLDAV